MTATSPMNPEIKILWTGRLRSGEIEQGQEYLSTGATRCCLGVLCDLGDAAGIIEARLMASYDDDGGPVPGGRWDYGQPDDEETLPLAIQAWAGLNSANPVIRVPGEIMPRLSEHARRMVRAGVAGPGTITLAQLNDAGVPFAIIADIIEATL